MPSVFESPRKWLMFQWQGLIITSSGLFDAEFYLQYNADVARKRLNPICHYLFHGAKEGRCPNAFFDPAYYLDHYQDVAWAGVDPLYHYHTSGWREGRRPSAAFDTQTYLERYPDVARAGVNPLLHFLEFGIAEGRLPVLQRHGDYFSIIAYDRLAEPVLTLPAFEDVEVSIVIPVHNQFNLTMGCLKAIKENTDAIRYEVILVDDVSTDEVASIERYVQNVILIRNSENNGFLRNCNNAARHARGKFIVLLNSDTNVQQDWLHWLLRVFERNADAGLVGPMMLFDDGVVQEAGVVVHANAECWCYGRDDRNPFRPGYQFVREVDYVSGACLLIRASLWQELGGFDEIYAPAYAEDMDLSFRVRDAGFKVFYQPKAVVVHFEGKSYGDVSGTRKELMARNRQLFAVRWQQVLLRDHPPQPADFGPPTDLFLARDRSRHKRHVFVSDIWVPEHDLNAGARCTRHYLELFREMGFRVTFHPRDNQRREPYATELEQLGIEVLFDVDVKEWIRQNLRYFDYIYLHRPDATVLLHVIESSREKDSRLIYFAHDLHHVRLRRQYEIEKDKAVLALAQQFEQKEREMFAAADVIHVVGEYEANLIRDQYPGKPVRDIPLFIFNDDGPVPRVRLTMTERKGLLFVGGFSHPPNRDAVHWLMQEVWPQISRTLPDVELFIAGSSPTPEIEAYDSECVHVTGYISDDRLTELYETCRMLIIPLRFGAGVKGKVLEAMYHGIPVMTTPVGSEGIAAAERAMIIHPCDGSWHEIITRWYSSPGELETLALSAHDLLMQRFSRSYAAAVLRQDMPETEWEKCHE